MASYEIDLSRNKTDVWILIHTDYGQRTFSQIPVATARRLAEEIIRTCESVAPIDADDETPQGDRL